jgi:filamentous hemagglutinin
MGIVRSNQTDWREWRDLWDEIGEGNILSSANRDLIAIGRNPVVDDAWIAAFPGQAAYVGEQISIHHIVGSPINVPLPRSLHRAAHQPGGFRWNPGGPGEAY